MEKTIILSDKDIRYKIKRIAYQIYETFMDQKEIYLAGIYQNGYLLADILRGEIEAISPLKVHLGKVTMDKKNPLNPVSSTFDLKKMEGGSLVLVDDVLNSGGVLMYGVRYFLDVPLKKFKTVVLVDRSHKRYPVKADFKGMSLSTSRENHVEVVFKKDGTIQAELHKDVPETSL